MVQTASYLLLAGRAQVHPSLSTLTFNCFWSFFWQSEARQGCTLCPSNECRRTGRPPRPPHPTSRHTSDTRILLTPPRRDTQDTTCGNLLSPWPRTGVHRLDVKSTYARSTLRCSSFARPPLRGEFVYFIFACTWFWPQTHKVYLFWPLPFAFLFFALFCSFVSFLVRCIYLLLRSCSP